MKKFGLGVYLLLLGIFGRLFDHFRDDGRTHCFQSPKHFA